MRALVFQFWSVHGERELGDGGKSSPSQPNCICVTKDMAHVCVHTFCGSQPMREWVGWEGIAQLKSLLEVGNPVEEKNEGLVQEGEVVA